MRFLKALWLVIFLFFSLTFFIQNSEALSQQLSLHLDFYYFDYVWTNTAVPFYFVILVSFAIGALVAVGYLALDRIRLGARLREAKREIKKLQKAQKVEQAAKPLPVAITEEEKTAAE